MPEEKEEWDAIYFRLPAEEKAAFYDAVAKIYGYKKGAVSQALRDLVGDFINAVNSTTKNTSTLRTFARILDAVAAEPDLDYTPLQKTPVWQTYEAILRALWATAGYYPERITLNEFITIIKSVRGRSRTTINKWKKELTKAGLVTVGKSTVRIHYPMLEEINIIEDLIKAGYTRRFAFALMNPNAEDYLLIYAVPVAMNPPHILFFSVRVNRHGQRLEHKAFMPYSAYKELLDYLQTPSDALPFRRVRKVIALLVKEHKWRVLPFDYLNILHRGLENIGVENAGVLLGIPAL